MSGRRLSWILFLLLAAALWLHLDRARKHWRVSRLLRTVEAVTMQASQRGGLPRRIGDVHLRLLREARQLDPALVDVPVAQGWQYLLLNRPSGAVRAFEEALALEPRARVYANLGEALLKHGKASEALEAIDRAILLDPRLEKDLRAARSQAERGSP